MNGGTISGNNATYGGGVYNYKTFNMNGGTISSNNATYGGGVYNFFAWIHLNGGDISYNKAVNGGGIYDNYLFKKGVEGDKSIVRNNSPDDIKHKW